MNEALKPYLARSFGAHLALAAAFVFLVPHSRRKLDKVYMIDFVGGKTATIASAGPAARAAAAAASAPQAVAAQVDPDAVAVKGRRHGPMALPRPSLLTGRRKDNDSGESLSTSLAGPGSPHQRESPKGSRFTCGQTV